MEALLNWAKISNRNMYFYKISIFKPQKFNENIFVTHLTVLCDAYSREKIITQ